MFDHVKIFIDQASEQRGGVPGATEQLGPKITGMIMSLPLPQLLMGISTYQGLFQKVQEAIALLLRSNNRGSRQ